VIAARLVGCACAAALAFFTVLAAPAGAMTIERVVSAGGIEAWLVQEKTVPLIAVEFAFRGGANEDPADKSGLAHMTASLLDEGAGDLDSRSFHEKLEDKAVQLSFRAWRDDLRGSLRTLSDNRDEAFRLLKLALTAPRFDDEAVERIRQQVLSNLRRETTSPNDLAYKRWWATAFPEHPYGRPTEGTLDGVPRIQKADLHGYVRRVLARGELKIAVVGDIDAQTLKGVLDDVFGALPAKPELAAIAPATVQGLGTRVVVDLDVPQTAIVFGGPGLMRKDPEFIPAFVVNHILGGGSFSSRLYQEVRESRGLAYSVYTGLVPLDYAAVYSGATATRADRAGDALAIIERQIRHYSETGPTAEELEKAKAYLKGSFALRFDTSAKIASQLVQIQLDDLGIDYIDRRNALIDAVTAEDVRRVAKRLYGGDMLAVLVGRSQGLAAKDGAPERRIQ
jgi:zinc protease